MFRKKLNLYTPEGKNKEMIPAPKGWILEIPVMPVQQIVPTTPRSLGPATQWPDIEHVVVSIPAGASFFPAKVDYVPPGFRGYIDYFACTYIPPVGGVRQMQWQFKIDSGTGYISSSQVNRAIGTVDEPVKYDPPYQVLHKLECLCSNFNTKIDYCVELLVVGRKYEILDPQKSVAPVIPKIKQIEEKEIAGYLEDKLEDLDELI